MIGIGIANSCGLNKLSGINPDAAAFIAAAGITGTTQVDAINTLVTGLQTDGLWSKMKAIYPFATDNRNLLGYTEDFSNAIWSKGGGTTVTANSSIAPDGTTTADTIVIPNNGTIAQPLVTATSQTFTLSIYLRASANTTIKLGFVSPSIVTTCNVTTTWQRFTITHTFTGTTFPQLYNDSGSSVTLFAWGAQADLGATASTYQAIATSQQAYIASQFKFNLKDPRDLDAAFRLVFNGGWTHSVTGATPNGVNAWGDTKLPNNTMAQNSMTMCTYLRTNSSPGLAIADLAVWNALFGSCIYANQAGNFRATNNGTNFQQVASADSLGFFLNKRINSTQITLQKNATLTTFASASQNLLNTNFIISRTGDFSGEYSNRQTAFVGIGDGLTDTEAANFYTRVQAFQTALSRQV
jgi:hypothetical protein